MIQRISASKDDDSNCINQKQCFTEVAVHRIFYLLDLGIIMHILNLMPIDAELAFFGVTCIPSIDIKIILMRFALI